MAGFAKNLMSFTGKLLGGGAGSQSAPSLAPPVLDDGAETIRRRRHLMLLQTLRGTKPTGNRGGTLLTGASGLSSPASPARKSLLGE